MPDLSLYHTVCLGLFVAGTLTLISLLFIAAPYGRYERKGWGPEMDERIGWMVMELVSPVTFLVFFLRSGPVAGVSVVLAAMFVGHYAYRALIYPFRMRGYGTKPVATVLMACLFNAFNGSVNGWGVANAAHLTHAWSGSPLFWGGICLFAFGLWLNLNSDARLRGLRAPGETGYKIPHGGGFRFVTSPNYLGEILEWTGFALASSTFAGWAFAFFTAANIGPRAFSHHRWYLEKFSDYPKDRKVILPFIL
ncbi:MAG: DUF1295 domain-containing protein [Pseudomonadota bacterium]